jgi:hypothetical protein
MFATVGIDRYFCFHSDLPGGIQVTEVSLSYFG